MEPQPLCLATALEMYPFSPETFSADDGEHVSDVSTVIME